MKQVDMDYILCHFDEKWNNTYKYYKFILKDWNLDQRKAIGILTKYIKNE